MCVCVYVRERVCVCEMGRAPPVGTRNEAFSFAFVKVLNSLRLSSSSKHKFEFVIGINIARYS